MIMIIIIEIKMDEDIDNKINGIEEIEKQMM